MKGLFLCTMLLIFTKTLNSHAKESDTYFNFLPKLIITLNENNNNENFKLVQYKDNYTVNMNVNETAFYLFGSLERLNFRLLFSNIKYEYNYNYIGNESDLIKNNGFHIFQFKQSIFNLVPNIIKTFGLFKGFNIENNNLKFIEEKMDFTYEKVTSKYNMNESDLNSGDVLFITRLDGLDPLIMWGTGSFVGHYGIILEINGTKYVCESTDKNPFGKVYWPPPYGIIKTPLDLWLKFAEKANFMVSYVKLSDKYRKRFNINNAIKEFNNLEGLPYGYHNLLFGWIDTSYNNFPENLTPELVSLIFAKMSRMDKYKNITKSFITEALNKRLNTEGLNFSNVIHYGYTKNISFNELITIPERDEWVYSDGKSRVCDTLVLSIYKAAGVFSDLANYLEATEFTPRNLYELNIFDNNTRDGCLNNEPYCQIMGNYKMKLIDFNTIEPYSHMNERCDTHPPLYKRNGKC